MRFIHVADIHLGSKMDSIYNNLKRKERKGEIRTSFLNVVSYAKKHGIKVIVIAGDLFDSDDPCFDDENFFYNTVLSNRDIDFLYLKGNHDTQDRYRDIPSNLKLFSDHVSSYRYDDCVFSGVELDRNNINTFYDEINLNKEDKNIVILHGQVASSGANIILSKLQNKNINYLALGHIHKQSINILSSTCVYVYPGCLEPRGFDETGKHGFVEVDTNDILNPKFCACAIREFVDLELDISNAHSDIDVYNIIIKKLDRDNMFLITLNGKIDFSVNLSFLEQSLKNNCYLLSIKNKCDKVINYQDFLYEKSLKGEFVRTVLADKNISETEKKDILELGLSKISGRNEK